MSDSEYRDRYQQWVEHVRSQNRDNVSQAIRDLNTEIGQLTRQLQESQESPEKVRAEIRELESQLRELTRRTQQLNGVIAQTEEQNRRRLREQIQTLLSRGDAILAVHERAAGLELLRTTDELLGLGGPRESLLDASPRRVERILKESDALPRLRRQLEEQAVRIHTELAATAAALPAARQREEERQQLNSEIAALEQQFASAHGVSRPVVEAVKSLRDDPGFLAFCAQQAFDARQELGWHLPKDVLAPTSAAAGER